MRNTDFILNIYEKKNSLSKLTTQLLYGENFTIQKNYLNWIKIKSKYDDYIGYIKKIYVKKNSPYNFPLKPFMNLSKLKKIIK